jgi:thiol-disulfide isomerase/thioredoxin
MIAAALAGLVAVLSFAAGDTGMPDAVAPTAAERGGLADHLAAGLRADGLRVVRGVSACSDAACAQRAGAALGARVVVYGTVTRAMALIWSAQAQLLDVRSGRVGGTFDIGYKGDYDALDHGIGPLADALDRRIAAAPAGRAAVGRPAPPFVVDALDGHEISLDAYRGRPVVINVFAAWCGSCRAELPRFVRAQAKYGSRVAFLAVDEQEGPSVARTFAHRLGVRFPIALDDGPMAAAYGASAIPETIVIDAHGIVRAISRGTIAEDALDRAVARVANPGGTT